MALANSKVAFTNVTAWAEVFLPDQLEPVPLPITYVELGFVENDIPTANIRLAVGSSVNGTTAVTSNSHVMASKMERGNPIVIWATLKGSKVPNVEWSDGKFAIFDGFIASIEYSSNKGAPTLGIKIDHWLIDLANTTRYSSMLHPSTPSAYFQPISVATSDGGFAASIRTDNYDTANLTAEGLAQDFGQAIKDYIGAMASKSWMSPELKNALNYADDSEVKNIPALTALDKFDLGVSVPLKVAEPFLDISKSMLAGFLTDAGDISSGSSFWEFMLRLGSIYGFTVLPFVVTATMAPVVRALSGKESILIKASEYTNLGSPPAIIQRKILRAVALFGKGSWFALQGKKETSNGPKDQISSFKGFADLYQGNKATAQYADGQIRLMECPKWLENSDMLTAYAGATIPFQDSLVSAAAADTADKQVQTEEDPTVLEKKVADTRIGDAIATQWLSDANLQSRQISITGRLRFDIAPGSQVKVEIIGKNVPFYKNAENNQNYIYGYVRAVSIILDSENAQASTTIHLTHIRTEAENNAVNLTLKAHPYYANVWVYTPYGLLEGQTNIP